MHALGGGRLHYRCSRRLGRGSLALDGHISRADAAPHHRHVAQHPAACYCRVQHAPAIVRLRRRFVHPGGGFRLAAVACTNKVEVVAQQRLPPGHGLAEGHVADCDLFARAEVTQRAQLHIEACARDLGGAGATAVVHKSGARRDAGRKPVILPGPDGEAVALLPGQQAHHLVDARCDMWRQDLGHGGVCQLPKRLHPWVQHLLVCALAQHVCVG